jgi:hypothetical protein
VDVAESSSSEVWLWPPCAVITTLTAAEVAGLGALIDLVGPPLRGRVGCELAAGHEGLHAAFVVAVDGGDRWWWIRWSFRQRVLCHLEICDSVDPGDGDDCLLMAGHPGRHSFQM